MFQTIFLEIFNHIMLHINQHRKLQVTELNLVKNKMSKN